MRLFVAVDLSAEARTDIAREQQRVARAFEGSARALRLSKPAQMHVTLAFIGEVDERKAIPIVAAMGVPMDAPVFRLSFGGIGIFPPRGKPRALFLGICDGLAALLDLHDRVVERLRAAGVPPGDRSFHPHLTLARWREGHAADRPLVEAEGTNVVTTVLVSEAVLYQSRLLPAGPAYTRLAHAPLT